MSQSPQAPYDAETLRLKTIALHAKMGSALSKPIIPKRAVFTRPLSRSPKRRDYIVRMGEYVDTCKECLKIIEVGKGLPPSDIHQLKGEIAAYALFHLLLHLSGYKCSLNVL